MCDYSLTVAESRPAVEGERLIVHRFLNGVNGFVSQLDMLAEAEAKLGIWARIKKFASPAKDLCAVCLEPGMQLVLRDISGLLRADLRLHSEEVVTFTHFGSSHSYRDAVRFRTGAAVLVQDLPLGMLADVVPAMPDPILYRWAEEPVGQVVPAVAC